MSTQTQTKSNRHTIMTKSWTRLHNGYQHSSGTMVRKNDNPTGIRNWWVEGGGSVGGQAAAKGCMGGFRKLSTAKKWVEHFAVVGDTK